MLELGAISEDGHRRVGRWAVENGTDFILTMVTMRRISPRKRRSWAVTHNIVQIDMKLLMCCALLPTRAILFC